MRRCGAGLVLLLAAWAGAVPTDGAASASEPIVMVLDWSGDADLVAAAYVGEGLETASREGVSLLVLRVDLSGGAEAALDRMARDIRGSRTPVAVFVAPAGAGLTAAGLRLLSAAHVAAMSPGTSAGGLSADVALARGLIDVVAADLGDLLAGCDGVSPGGDDAVPLRTAGAWILERPPSWRWLFLDTITEPDLAYLLLMIGLVGLLHALRRPWVVLPAIVGALALLLALVALKGLPAAPVGLVLIGVGALLLRLATRVISYGALYVGGVAALLLGSLHLYGAPGPLSPRLILPTILLATLAAPGVLMGRSCRLGRGLEAPNPAREPRPPHIIPTLSDPQNRE